MRYFLESTSDLMQHADTGQSELSCMSAEKSKMINTNQQQNDK